MAIFDRLMNKLAGRIYEDIFFKKLVLIKQQGFSNDPRGIKERRRNEKAKKLIS